MAAPGDDLLAMLLGEAATPRAAPGALPLVLTLGLKRFQLEIQEGFCVFFLNSRPLPNCAVHYRPFALTRSIS